MRHGFKSYASRVSLEVRGELGLQALDPMDPLTLANHLAIPVHPLSDFAGDAPGAWRRFTGADRSLFSGLTVLDGHRRLIVYNDDHSPGRQASTICHELAHGLLFHPLGPALDGRGLRFYDSEIEDEASFLGAALLMTEEAAISIVAQGVDMAAAAERHGVSEDLLRWRINVTGARKRAQRRAGLRTKRGAAEPVKSGADSGRSPR